MKLTTKELTVFAMLGTLMYLSKMIMEFAPNVHLLGVLTIAFTIVYRQKALYPIYTYVFLNGLFAGFSTWWIPYLYIWTVLWGIVMILPKKMPAKIKPFVYMFVCMLHGLSFGILYAPMQAILYGYNLNALLAWIVAGFPWDLIHGISNFFCGILIMPIVLILTKLKKYTTYNN